MNTTVFRVVLVLLMNYASMASAQCAYVFKGRITDFDTGEELSYARVYLKEQQLGAASNDHGYFEIQGVCPGKVTVSVTHLGCLPQEMVIEIKGNTNQNFRMAHAAQELKTVDIKAIRGNNQVVVQDKISHQQMAEKAGTSIGDMLKSVNGVNGMQTGANIVKPVIHGLHSNRILMVNNGVRLESQQWGSEHAPEIDPFTASQVTVVKGAAAVRYGADAMGGVVLMDPAPIRSKPGWDGQVNLAGFSNNRMGVAAGMIEHNFAKIPCLSIRLQGTLKQGGNYRIPGYWVDNTGIRERNYTAMAAWKKSNYGFESTLSQFNTTIGIYSGSHAGNRDDLMAAINSPVPLRPAGFTYDIGRPYQQVDHLTWKNRAYWFTPKGNFNLVYAYQKNYRQEYDVVRSSAITKAQLNLTIQTHLAELTWEQPEAKGWSGMVGLTGIRQTNYFEPGDRIFIPNFISYSAGAYAIEKYKLHDWNLEAGARYDNKWFTVYNLEGNNQQVVRHDYVFGSLSGTLGASRQWDKHWNTLFNIATAWRAPQANELFVHGNHQGAGRWENGDPNLVPERGLNFSGKVTYTLPGSLSVEAEVYHNRIDNFIYLQPAGDLLTISGYFKQFNYTQTNAALTGADVSASWTLWKNLDVTPRASWLLARDVSRHDWLISMPSDRYGMGVQYNFRQKGWLDNPYLKFDVTYVTQQKRIPANFDALDYPRPPAAYTLAAAYAGTKLHLNGFHCNVVLGVGNLFNVSYRDYLDAFRYFVNAPGRNVSLKLEVPFEFIAKNKN